MLAFKTLNCLDGKGHFHMQKSFTPPVDVSKNNDVKYQYLLVLSTKDTEFLMALTYKTEKLAPLT